jgi:predicted nucleotidyltransferase
MQTLDDSTKTVTNYLVGLAKERLGVHEVILFGSRARGDARPKSDYDVAFRFDKDPNAHHWGAFCLEAQENAPTLLPMDLVNLNEVSTEFASKIRQEGIVVYKEEK